MSEELALSALSKVEELAGKLGEAEALLESGYAELASAILDVRENRYWEGEQYASWGDYMKYIADKFHMGRAQLYHKIGVVKELQGVVEPEHLSEMGIAKASVLADAHRAAGGSGIPKELIARAREEKTTVKQLKQAIAEATHGIAPEETGWYDMNFAFYVTDEERKELQEADELARSLDPPISTTLKDFMQKKEVALRWAREFMATYVQKEDEDAAPGF